MSNKITIDEDFFEHLLNCLANQKYIHEQPKTTQKDWQKIIDKAWNQGMKLLTSKHVINERPDPEFKVPVVMGIGNASKV